MYSPRIRYAFVLTAGLAIAAFTASAVSARAVPFRGVANDTFTDVICGLDVTTTNDLKISGRSFVDHEGNPVQFQLKLNGTDTWTYAPTGLSVVWAYNVLYKNFNDVDNGDGTVELDQRRVGKFEWIGPGGELLASESGPITVHVTIDMTVDPWVFTEVVLSEHGHHPDVCPAVRDALLGV